MSRRAVPRRVAARPDPAQWGEDELLTLAEAAALLFPDGPLTASSLRTSYRRRILEVHLIARKLFTTKAAVAKLVAASKRPTHGSGDGCA